MDPNGHRHFFNILAILNPIVAPNKPYSDSFVQIQIHDSNTNMVYGELARNYSSIKFLGTKDSENNSDVFVAVPYLSNDFELLILTDSVHSNSSNSVQSFNGLQSVVQTTCRTMHRVCSLELQIYDDFVLTWSMGGDIETWDKTNWTMSNRVRAMNVWAGGIKKAVVDHSLQ